MENHIQCKAQRTAGADPVKDMGAPFRTVKGREGIGTPSGSPRRQSARLRPGEGPSEDPATWCRAAA
jgi:hypothetical protein